MSLLAHRGPGRRRSGPGFFQQVASALRSVVGGRADVVSPRRAPASAGLAVVGSALFCLGAGYALGNAFPWKHADAAQGLKASVTDSRNGVVPGPIGEQEDMRPRSRTFFLTAGYAELNAGSAAARTLRQAGLVNARLREFQGQDGKMTYGLVVYYDGDEDREAVRKALQAVPAPDSTFDGFRKGTRGWPQARELR